MEKTPKELVIKLLEGVVEAFKADTSEIDTETALMIVDLLAHRPLTKEQACIYLGGMSRSKFDLYVSLGKLPKGIHRMGYHGKVWFADELNKCKTKL